MKVFLRSSHFILFAYLLFLSQGQDDVDGLFKSGWDFLLDDAIIPAAGALQNLLLNTAPVRGKPDPAQGFVVPQTDPGEQTTTNPGSDNLPGELKSPEPDVEVIINPADDEKCDPNDAGVGICYIPLIPS